MFKLIIDEHIELRYVTLKDTHALYTIVNENRDYFRPWFGWLDKMTDESIMTGFIRSAMKDYGNGQGPKVTIWYDKVMVGFISHQNYKAFNKSIAIGYWMDKNYTGKGIMTKACKAMIDVAFERDIHKVEIYCATHNMSSRKIPERLGFIEEGTIRAAELINGEYVDNVVYGILKEEWQ